jgi:hypothetical protein
VWKRRFVCDDSHVHDRYGKDRDVRRKNNQEPGKRARSLCNTDFVQPDDVPVRIRNLGAVMVEMRDIGAGVVMRPEVTVRYGGVMIG